MLRYLKVILWKNFLIRKKHWLLTITEIVIPIILFGLLAYGRSKIDGLNKVQVPYATYYDPMDELGLNTNLPVGDIHLWYTPYTDLTESIIKKIQDKFGIPGQATKDFSSEEQMLNYFSKNNTQSIYALTFKGNDRRKLDYDISIYDRYLTWNTDKLFPSMFSESSEYSKSYSYIYKGFAALQIAVDLAFMEISLGKDDLNLQVSIQEFPYPPYTQDDGLTQLFLYFLPLITIFSFIFLCPAVLQRVGEEKHSGTKEYLKMVGVKSWILWVGWLVHALATNIFSIVAIVVLMKVPFWGVPYPPIENCDGVVLFLFLFLYCTASTTLCFLIATIFRKPCVATVVGVLIWILSYFIPDTLSNSHENLLWTYKILLAVFPNMALKYGYSAISVYESRGVGLSWENLFQSGSGGDEDVTMGDVFLVLIVDMVILMLLTIYIENIHPGKYGIPKPLSFPLTFLKNWIKTSCKYIRTTRPNEIDPETGSLNHQLPCIQIRELYKKYYKTVAVDNLSMDIPANKITVFLGHNGAGKTTTMSILTGMINATKGTIHVNGKNIRTHTDEVRHSIGLCPQHNLLFADLSVEEHLIFFAMLKGVSDIKEKVMDILEKFHIETSRNALTHALSGGMKRKLCLGMALIGNSDVLVLDEPTSGMDPESRRTVWDILLEYKKTKTVLISTHLMEEADVLGDKIAIMANGRLQCYDTPMRLKNQYNTGYHLSILLKDLDKKIVTKITENVQRVVSGAILFRDNGENIVYLLPLDQRENYSKLFTELEKNKEPWSIVTMGLSLTTLEDVFLKAHDAIDEQNDEPNNIVQDTKTDEGTFKTRSLQSLLLDQNILNPQHQGRLKSLLLKRWFFFKKKFHWYIPATFVAICTILLTMWLNMSNTKYFNYDGSPLNLDLSIYGKTKVFYGGNDLSNPEVALMRGFYDKTVSNEKSVPISLEDVSQGIINSGIENIAHYKKHLIAGAEFNYTNEEDKIIVNAMYSSIALHSIPISINLAMNAVAKTLLGESFSITTRNTPIKIMFTDYSPSELSPVSVGIFWVILIPIAMTFLMSSIIIFPNTELSTNFVKLQTRAGVNIIWYWIVNIVFDWLTCLLKLVLLLSCMVVMNLLLSDPNIFETVEFRALAAIFALYTFTSLPFTYLFSYRKTISSGFSTFLVLGLVTGITPAIVVYALELSGDDKYMMIGKYLQHILLITSPQFGLSYVCLKFSQKYVENFNWHYMESQKRKFVCENMPNPCCSGNTLECVSYKNYFSNEKYGIMIQLAEMLPAFLIYLAILYFVNTVMFEKLVHFFKYFSHSLKKLGIPHFLKQLRKSRATESDKSENGALVATDLNKAYGSEQIVKDLNLKLKKNKCFGLLGVNGAGKSSTFSMLAKTLFSDKGAIKIKADKEYISSENAQYSEKIGYCPQEDSFNFFLSGRELLQVMALIRGYTRDSAKIATNELLECFGLTKYADIPCLDYSGGNRRKLATSLAFLGSPSIILLDEPTSGVDPASRRKFWKILSSLKKSERSSFLLCSHSMEECENLCDEIGIMKTGQMKDEGTLLELKQRYQKGYKIEVKLNVDSSDQNETDGKNPTEPDAIQLKTLLDTELGTGLKEGLKTELKKHDGCTEVYEVDKSETLSHLFEVMERIKKNHSNLLDDYSISDISLEDVFLLVANESELVANEPELVANVPELVANEPEANTK